jgi:ferric-dicitrate binding protein FerR (iron transport regulator)
VHEQLGAAGAGLRDAYVRARRLPAREAVQDKTLYDRARQAATGLTEAARRAVGKPEPKPRRRLRGLLALVALAAGAVVFWAAKRRGQPQDGAGTRATSPPQPAPTSPTTTPPGTDPSTTRQRIEGEGRR